MSGTRNMMPFISTTGLWFALAICLLSCEEFVSVPAPETELVPEHVFKSDATALSAISDVYGQMSTAYVFSSGDLNSVTAFEGVYADELIAYTALNSGTALSSFYLNSVVPNNSIVVATWGDCYTMIFKANRIIEGLMASNTISPSLKSQLQGEALFVRAFCHFYLVNLFGDVPLITTSDYRINATVSRTPAAQVYRQIIADLLLAQQLLAYAYPSVGRVRPNRAAATALLARAYLYVNEFDNAEAQATKVIDNTAYKLESDLDRVFLKVSEEAIWQLLPFGGNNLYTYEGRNFILLTAPSSIALKTDLAKTFERGDRRRKNWIDSLNSNSGLTTWYFPFKYKENSNNGTGSEASMVLRLAEQYLIRAEARAKAGKLTGDHSAQSDVNVIRSRAGLTDTMASTEEELLAAIEMERRLELFAEWGHRFFDLKRTGRLDAVLGGVKPNWTNTDALLPLPQTEILNNKNLSQNPGY